VLESLVRLALLHVVGKLQHADLHLVRGDLNGGVQGALGFGSAALAEMEHALFEIGIHQGRVEPGGGL